MPLYSVLGPKAHPSEALTLVARNGRAAGRGGKSLEHLEQRTLMAGDHASFSQFPNVNAGDVIAFDAQGRGSLPGTIETLGGAITERDDLFKFIAPQNPSKPGPDFLTIRADSLSLSSPLDTRLDIYQATTGGQPLLIASSSGSGTLTGGAPSDASVGFIATPGAAYYVKVSSDAGPGAPAGQGGYVLRVNGFTKVIAISGTDGSGASTGSVVSRGDETVFSFTMPANGAFDGVATITAASAALDTRVDLYDSEGRPVTFDSDSGHINDAFATWRNRSGQTYYARVRSDKFAAGSTTATGNFALAVDGAATQINLDRVRRYGTATGVSAGKDVSSLLSFVTLGSGYTVITAAPEGPTPTDLGMRLYKDDGTFIGFSDLPSNEAGIELQLEGNRRYFLVIEDFDGVSPGTVGIGVEANETLSPGTPLDDHANLGDWDRATGLAWSAPGNMKDYIRGGTISDRDKVVTARGWGRLNSGTDTDLFTFTPPVDMLGSFAGKKTSELPNSPPPPPDTWQNQHRPATRLHVLVSRYTETASFAATLVMRVYDSKHNLLKENALQYSGVLAAFPEKSPQGMWDPASYDPDMQLPLYAFVPVDGEQGIEVWGGEQYFIDISDGNAGTGRYNFYIYADSAPVDTAGAGTGKDNVSNIVENSGAPISGVKVRELTLSDSLGNTTGDYSASNGLFDRSSLFERGFEIKGGSLNGLGPAGFNPFAAGAGIVILQESGMAAIEGYDDMDYYQVRALRDGTMEIRVNTTDISDFFNEFITDGEANPASPTTNGGSGVRKTKVYDSALDSALRIYDNDFTEVAYNNDNAGVETDTQTVYTGINERVFHRRDAKVVFPVEAGKTYYIRVESGQRDALLRNKTDATQPVDWAHAIGSYELLIHNEPNTGFFDDAWSDLAQTFLATTIPLGTQPGSPNLGKGSIGGNIEIAGDTDLFTFTPDRAGPAEIKLSRAQGSLLDAGFTLLAHLPGEINGEMVAQIVMQDNGVATLPFLARQGVRYTIAVSGTPNAGGQYQIDVTTTPLTDDAADFASLALAKDVVTRDFLGSGAADGTLENTRDTDVYRFTPDQIGTYNVEVRATSGGLNPAVDIFELGLDPTGRTVLMRIAGNDDTAPMDLTARTIFSVTSDRTSNLSGVSRSYSTYYIVVRASDPTRDSGGYRVDVTFAPTDDHADSNEYDFATPIPISTTTGAGSIGGMTEKGSDSDLFSFTAPAGGDGAISVSRAAGSEIVPKVTVFTTVNGALTTIASGLAVNGTIFLPADTGVFKVTRSQTYFVLVENTGSTWGAYSVSVNVPAMDDHANADEFSLATTIGLSATTGDGFVGTSAAGPSNPTLAPAGDTDLFRFTPQRDGTIVVTLRSYSGANGAFTPRVRVMDSLGVLLPAGDVSATSAPSGSTPATASFTFTGGKAGTMYYVLVSSAAGAVPPATVTGEYQLLVDTPKAPDGSGGDPGAIDFATPVRVALDAKTGYGEIADKFDAAGDRDLFDFVIPAGASGTAYLQLVTPTGSVVDGAITILGAPDELAIVASDSLGIPGASASATLKVAAGSRYWVLVSGVGTSVGSYRLRVSTPPVTQYLYFPEGYASQSIREFVSVSNNSDATVKYSVIAYYENTSLPPTVIARDFTLAPGARGGVTTSNAGNPSEGQTAGLRLGEPYTVVIESNGPLGATMAHYDFGATLGDAFSGTTADTWLFPRVERNPGAVKDYLLFFNPGDSNVIVESTAYTEDGTAIPLPSRTVAPNRRAGLSIDDIPNIPAGIVSVKVKARPASSQDAASFRGIVSSLSHYDTAGQSGYAALGDSTAGSTTGAVTSIINGQTATGELVVFNPSSSIANVTLTADYIVDGLPDSVRHLSIAPGAHVVLTGAAIGLAADQPAGIRYTSSVPISVASSELERGEADASIGSGRAGTALFFGDGFMNSTLAGSLYFETLAFFNPTSTATVVTVKLLFTGISDFIEVGVNVNARSFARLNLHELPQLVQGRPGLSYYSVQASSDVPILATMTHFDLFLRGGFTTEGVPLGLTNPVSSIS